MPRSAKVYQFLFIILLCIGCRGNPSDSIANATAVPTRDPAFATPALTLSEDPLASQITSVPSVHIITARQSKSTLATFLKTTSEQLDWVNPGLPDLIPAGRLVVIPPVYRTNGETLNDVSEKTGLPIETLLSYNPNRDVDTELAEGELLTVPPLYIVPEETLVTVAAEALGTDKQALLSANPELADEPIIATGTILVVPLSNEEE